MGLGNVREKCNSRRRDKFEQPSQLKSIRPFFTPLSFLPYSRSLNFFLFLARLFFFFVEFSPAFDRYFIWLCTQLMSTFRHFIGWNFCLLNAGSIFSTQNYWIVRHEKDGWLIKINQIFRHRTFTSSERKAIRSLCGIENTWDFSQIMNFNVEVFQGFLYIPRLTRNQTLNWDVLTSVCSSEFRFGIHLSPRLFFRSRRKTMCEACVLVRFVSST